MHSSGKNSPAAGLSPYKIAKIDAFASKLAGRLFSPFCMACSVYKIISTHGIDSVRSAIKELEHHGYVERHRLRNEYGFYGDTEYIIREVPLGEEND